MQEGEGFTSIKGDKQKKIHQQEEKYEQMHTTKMILGVPRKNDSLAEVEKQ